MRSLGHRGLFRLARASVSMIVFIASIIIQPAWGDAGWSFNRSQAQTFGGCYVAMRPVPSLADPQLNDIAMAYVDPQLGPAIRYNPYVAFSSNLPVQFFFYYHECAHHVLGHTIGMSYPLNREQEADCWAIRELVGRGLFGPNEVAQVQSTIAAAGRADWAHLPGPVRAINLYACLQ